MKLTNIFLVLIFFISIIGTASASTYVNGSLQIEGYATSDTSVNDDDFASQIENLIHYMEFHYSSEVLSGIPYLIEYDDVSITYYGAYEDLPQTTGGCFQIWDETTEVGTGNLFITKQVDKGSSDAQVNFKFYFDSESFTPGTNKIYDLKLYTHVINNYYNYLDYGYTIGGDHPEEYSSLTVGISPFTYGTGGSNYRHTMSDVYGATDVEYTRISDFRNDYSIKIDNLITSTDINRNFSDNTVSSKYVVRNEDDSLFYESGHATSNTTHNEITNNTQKIYIEPQASGIEHLIYQYTAPAYGDSVGTIELNQSSYTNPELIQIDAELTTYDFDNRNYYIITDVSEDLDVWHMVSGTYNATTVMSNATASRTLQLNSEYYDLPIWIRSTLREYNPTTGIYTDFATSITVLYNPPTAYDYTLSGTVFDAGTYSVIEGATVTAVGPINASATTSSSGRFTLYLMGGSYTITGSKSGFVDNVNEDIIIASNISLYNIYLTQTSYTNGTMNGIIKDADTGESIQDVHLIFTNATDRIDAYSSVGGYYTASGFEQSTSYDIRAIKSGYYSYNGSVTIEATGGTTKSFDMVQIDYAATPTPTVLATYPDGEGHAWTNEEIVTMLRIVVPGIFMMMFIFLLLAVLMGVGGNNGGNGGQGMGMKELWQR